MRWFSWISGHVLALAFCVAACGGDDAECQDPQSTEPGCEDPNGSDSIVGSNALQYTEQDDVGNSEVISAEATAYTLDEIGIVISGSFGTDDVDRYVFSVGTTTRLDALVFVDGVAQNEANYQVTISIDAVEDDGFSVLRGNGYFLNAGLPNANKDYVLSITGGSDRSYTIEMKGNPE